MTEFGFEDVDPFSAARLPPAILGQVVGAVFASPADPDSGLCDPGSPAETTFFAEWVGSALGPGAARWFIPQARLDIVAASHGLAPGGQVNVDFLVNAPWLDPFIVEIDGAQHADATMADGARDEIAAQCGLEVVRVATDEVAAGNGPGLDRIVSLWQPAPEGATVDGAGLAVFPAQLHRCGLALIEAIGRGFLAGDRWVVELSGIAATDVAQHFGPYLDLFGAIDALWGDSSVMPAEVCFRPGADEVGYVRTADGYRKTAASAAASDLRIDLDIDRTPYERLPQLSDLPVVVVRSCSPPVAVRDPGTEGTSRERPEVDGDLVEGALHTVLRSVFAKPGFREGQLDGVTEVLSGRDCAVLLPTGAGKSLIYQLAGLCLPGRTIIVDPLTALIEDQADGLRENGVDRVVAVTMDSLQEAGSEIMHREVSSGDALFIFVSPERMQRPRFRQALSELSAFAPVSLAVIDEAHCVSEWGHDFRPAYLLLGETLRARCRHTERDPLPLLALTGTASRAVLNDVLLQLGVHVTNERSIVRPRSFDRAELQFHLSRVPPGDAESELRGTLAAIPQRFGQTAAAFYAPRREKTSSGIIFCQTVKGGFGITKAAQAASDALGFHPPIYAGSVPEGFAQVRWPAARREAARSFKSNEQPALVSTKAFGMGIDKPNIRWVVHYGMPGSIEAWYQEVGRAGRDGQLAHCHLILVDYDEERNRGLLELESDTELLRERANVGFRTRDSVTTALFFLTSSFRGTSAELETLTGLVNELEPDSNPRNVVVSAGGADRDQKSREQALARLIRLGVVKDYSVSGSELDIAVAGVAPSTVVDRLVDYIERSQPGRGALVRESVEHLGSEKLVAVIEDSASALIDFVYDTIYRSRLRSIREMWLAARSGDGGLLRRRALDYLQEGDATPVLEALIRESRFSLDDWAAAIANIQGPRDAAEWRGATARLLQSDPDHTGLLLARVVAELRSSETDLKDVEANLVLLIESAERRFGVDQDLLTRVLSVALAEADQSGSDALAVCAEVTIRYRLDVDGVRRRIKAHCEDSSEDDLALSAVFLASELGRTYSWISDVDDELKRSLL